MAVRTTLPASLCGNIARGLEFEKPHALVASKSHSGVFAERVPTFVTRDGQ